MTTLQVRVGVVSWNTASLLDGCLTSLPGALEGVRYDVVVVDNASTDDSAAVARRHPGVTVVENDVNRGYARAMNQALGGTDARVLIALNPDTVPPPGSLATLVDRLAEDDRIGLVGPRLVGIDGRAQPSAYRFPAPGLSLLAMLPSGIQRGRIGRRYWLEAGADYTQRADVPWMIGAVHVIRREALAGRPPYDERWFMYAEDVELCWWLSRRGWRRRLEGDVTVTHVGNAAGAQAWGSGRTRVHLEAAADWMERDRGRLYTAAWRGTTALSVAVVGRFRRSARDDARWLLRRRSASPGSAVI